jgi:hypothetical protein
MNEPLEEDGESPDEEPAVDTEGSSLYGWFLLASSRPWFRFAFRVAIPIVVVIVVAIIVSSH